MYSLVVDLVVIALVWRGSRALDKSLVVSGVVLETSAEQFCLGRLEITG